jgi:hypothetical protein
VRAKIGLGDEVEWPECFWAIWGAGMDWFIRLKGAKGPVGAAGGREWEFGLGVGRGSRVSRDVPVG